MITKSPTIENALREWSCKFDEHLASSLEDCSDVPDELARAMRHSLLAPGKRLRPFLVDRSYRLAGGTEDRIFSLCSAVECLHAFTLIHDDLPAMDDAELRRGHPSNHRVFGEAMAILAGDALLALGLELAGRTCADSGKSLEITQLLSRTIGWQGVIGGQAADLLGEHRPADLTTTRQIHLKKTASFFEACCAGGALAAHAGDQVFNNLSKYGLNLGLAFQIADDLLDATGATEALGKRPGRDSGTSKQSYPNVVGIEASRKLGSQATQKAIEALADFDEQADELRQVAAFVMNRNH